MRECFKSVCPSLSWQSIIHKSIISYLTFWRQNSSSAMYYFFRDCPSLIICLLFQDAGFFKDSWHLTLDAKHWKTCNSFFWSYLFIYLFIYLFALKVGLTSSNSSSSGKWPSLIGKFMILAIHGRFISKILMDVLPLVLVLSYLES